jgi:CBS domain-containing membrane protein
MMARPKDCMNIQSIGPHRPWQAVLQVHARWALAHCIGRLTAVMRALTRRFLESESMSSSAPRWQDWLPARPSVNAAERLRAAVGALIGILVTGILGAWTVGLDSPALWLMAPMGASAVLLFAVPSSPLAQPWSIVGGNLLAVLIGVTCARYVEPPVLAAASAVCLAIAAMFALRCLHPPSGAVALMAVLGGPVVHAAGYRLVWAPVLLNSLCLLVIAVVYNRLTGRRYPHPQQVEAPPKALAGARGLGRPGFNSADLQAALRAHNEVIDVSTDDLEALFRQTEQQAFRRLHGDARCRDIMAREVPHAEFATELEEAWRVMRIHRVQALPVIDRARRVIGIVTRADFLRHADLRDDHGFGARLHSFLRRTAHTHSHKHEVVGQIMSAPAETVPADASIAALVPLMSHHGWHHVPVVDSDRRLVGMVTQDDLVAALFDASLAQPGARSAAPANPPGTPTRERSDRQHLGQPAA